jgi:hypothetical protein
MKKHFKQIDATTIVDSTHFELLNSVDCAIREPLENARKNCVSSELSHLAVKQIYSKLWNVMSVFILRTYRLFDAYFLHDKL